MAFLTIAGITVPISTPGASQKANEVIGTDSRAYAGNLRSTVRSEKRNWQFSAKPMLPAADTTLRAAVANGAFVTCSGDALNGASVTCRVTITDGPYVNTTTGLRRTLMLSLREV